MCDCLQNYVVMLCVSISLGETEPLSSAVVFLIVVPWGLIVVLIAVFSLYLLAVKSTYTTTISQFTVYTYVFLFLVFTREIVSWWKQHKKH